MRFASPSERALLDNLKLAAAFLVVAAAVVAASGCGGSAEKKPRRAAAAQWSPAPSMPHRRSYTASAEIGGKIYVAGGMVGNTGRPLDVFEEFDPRTDDWSALPAVPAAFSAAAGARPDDPLWVVGGDSPPTTGRQV